MGYKRIIRFQYYQLLMDEMQNKKKVQNKSKIFNFAEWVDMVTKQKLIRKPIDFNNAKARIEHVKFSKNYDVWCLQLMKLRDTNVPAKAKDFEEAQTIELDDNEYIGEDLYMIYDAKKGIAMIQQNKNSLGVSRVEEFLQHTYNLFWGTDHNKKISIEPIVGAEGMAKLSKGSIRYIELSLANLNSYTPAEKTPLSEMINQMKTYQGVAGKVMISIGRGKGETLDRKKAQELAKEAREASEESNKRLVRGAKIKIKEEEDADVEIVDLLEDVCHDFIEFDLNKRERLDYNVVTSRMCTKYANRKLELYRLVDPNER